jgi:hypothetical protein
MQPGTLDPRVTFTRGSTATYFDNTGTMQTVSGNTPRWDYNPSTLALNGLLIEEARTNIILGSPGFSATYWSFPVGGGSVAFNTSGAPDGTTTGSTQTKTGTAEGVFRQVFSVPATNVPYCFSLFVKQGTSPYANIAPGFNGATSFPMIVLRWSDLTLASRGGGNAALAYGMSPIGNGWYRLWIAAQNTGSATGGVFDIRANGDAPAGMGDGTESGTLLIWGAQLEQGAFPTSCIPTTAAAVTRAVDVCSISPANMGWFTPPGGSWFAEFISQTPLGGNQYIITYAVASKIPLYLAGGGNLGQYDSVAPMGTGDTMTVGAIGKGATTWLSNTARACLNGGAVASSGALTAGYSDAGTVGISLLQLSAQEPSSMTGYIRRVRYWPRVLSNFEMQSVTT